MAKMFPPNGHVSTNIGKRDKDGAYEVPEHMVFEMERVHGFRRVMDGRPLTPDELDAKAEERRREAASYVQKIEILNAEVQTLSGQVNALTKERDNLAAQLRRANKA